MANIFIKIRAPMDTAPWIAGPLIEELEQIGEVEIERPIEQRGLPPEALDIAEAISIKLLDVGLGMLVTAIGQRWVNNKKKSKHERQERAIDLYGPDGKVIKKIRPDDS